LLSIRVREFLLLCFAVSDARLFPTESIRYLDVHPVMPDGSPPQLKDSFDSLLAPLLLNSALAALKVHPQTPFNARIGVGCATRALDRMALSNADKGECSRAHIY